MKTGYLLRRIIGLGGLVVWGLASSALAASITSTGTVATDVSANWVNWTAVRLSLGGGDNSRATTPTSGAPTYSTGTLSGFDFSAIPSTAVIEGIEVTLEASESATSVDGYLMTAVSSNSGTNYSSYSRTPDAGELTTSDVAEVEGGPTNTWGQTWTVAGVTSTFKVQIWAYDANAAATTRVDYVGVTVYYDATAPAARADFTSTQSTTTSGQINLTWTAPGDDGSSGNLTGNYRIQYATYTATWSTGSTPTNATTVTIATTSATPGSAETKAITGLVTQTTYYFVLWSQDNVGLWSDISNSTFTYLDLTAPSTSTVATSVGAGQVTLSWNSAGDDGSSGNLTGNYRIQYATYTATWSTSTTPTNATTVTIATTSMVPGSAQGKTITGLTTGTTYYFVLWSQDDAGNWSSISNTPTGIPPYSVTLAESVGQAGWMAQGETARILGVAGVTYESAAGVTISSVAVRETGSYTADGNLTNVEVWISSSGYIDGNAIRLDGTSKSFSSDVAVFDQDVTVSTTPLYFIARADVAGAATEGTFEIGLQLYTTAVTVNNPIAFSNATDVVAPPSGAPSGLSATASSNLLRVSLSWGAGTGADTYSVYRATHSGVTTTDFLLGITNSTSFNDDYIPPAQQMYYKVIGTNRAGSSSASGSANATSVDVPALTTSNIYLRAGSPGNFGSGNMALNETVDPANMFVDHVGNIYIADFGNNRIRFVPKTSGTYFGVAMTANSFYTIAGNGEASTTGDGGLASSATLNKPYGVCADLQGNVFVTEENAHVVRFIPKTSGTYFGVSMTANYIYTLAGDAFSGTGLTGDGGLASSSKLSHPFDVKTDAAGNVYIADTGNNRVRFIPKTSGTYFGVAMTANYIYKIAGTTGGDSGDGGLATSAQFNSMHSLSVDAGGNIYISDHLNSRIRFIPRTSGTYFGAVMTANYVYSIAGGGGSLGDGGLASSSKLDSPGGVSVDGSGNVFVSDGYHRIRFIPKTSGTYFGSARTANYIYTIAGNGTAGFSGDGGLATSANINYPDGISVDGGGNVYFSDNGNSRIRFVPKTTGTYFGEPRMANYIYTLVGNGWGNTGDSGVATSGRLDPNGVAVDGNGNIYIADGENYRVRFIPKTSGSYFGVSMTGNSIYTIAGGRRRWFLHGGWRAGDHRTDWKKHIAWP